MALHSQSVPTLLAKAARRLIVPLVPRRDRLRALSRIARLGGQWEPELAEIERMLPTERRVAIDVGANEGLYSLRLSAMFEHVFSFEINAAIAADLVATQLANVTVVSNGLSRSMGRATLYVPVLPSGQRLHGWASLNVGNCPDAVDHDRHDVAIATLDSYGIDNASFLKIDVEGHEFQMLEGARATIERCKPRILIEIKSANLSRVRAYFAALGYREIDLRKLLRAPPTPENHLFFPGDGAR